MSIWDAPKTPHSETDRTHKTSSALPSAGTVGARERIFGKQAGTPLLTRAGRGVIGGVPYGESANRRAEALNAQYPFQPGVVARLRAATQASLGRGATGGIIPMFRTIRIGETTTYQDGVDPPLSKHGVYWGPPPEVGGLSFMVHVSGMVDGESYENLSGGAINNAWLVLANDLSTHNYPIGSVLFVGMAAPYSLAAVAAKTAEYEAAGLKVDDLGPTASGGLATTVGFIETP